MNVWRIFIFILCFSMLPIVAQAQKTAIAIFAAGCFWCAEHDFKKVPGVMQVISGYTGGRIKNPTYEQVSKGATDHLESIQVRYNPEKITYQQLLQIFWKNVDPTDEGGQFCDRGNQYRSAIFYGNQQEKQWAEQSKSALSSRFKQIATLILPSSAFYPAESYHQDYANKNPIRYKYYRYRCGRDKRLVELWGKT